MYLATYYSENRFIIAECLYTELRFFVILFFKKVFFKVAVYIYIYMSLLANQNFLKRMERKMSSIGGGGGGGGTTFELTAESINSSHIINGSILATDISNNAITTSKIIDNTVTSNKLQGNSIVTSKIASNTIIATQLQGNCVITSKIADEAVTIQKLSLALQNTLASIETRLAALELL